ncbi:nucleolar protein 13 [Zygosaccharomyces mellis]|uniref:Nucleolar protein 13 n=1 Tax=Zygosaccharomyces mellis TaxID=42258 RepID=A0A4C2E5F9_9SACH|nr:nucleolar protein 13 [Zygosaccharomyces mellis]
MTQETKAANKEQVQQALQDPTKKRKAEDEIEIDLEKPVPLSKKQKRLLRRGKVTIEELDAKYNLDPSSVEEYKRESNEVAQESTGLGEEEEKTDSKKKEKGYGVWIGNLSFDTSKEDISRFLVAKTRELEESDQISENAILRVHMPLAQNDGKKIKNKGFCYVDFKTVEQMESAVSLSESQLNGRNLLIKNSKNFEGRPDKDDLVANSKNPPSRILFIGNLSFDTSDDLLRKHFQHCGQIIKVRMATFQDSGKCKGFAFIDFKNEQGATNALRDKSCRKIAGRSIRMEYGEDRSKRQVKKKPQLSSSSAEKPFDLPNQIHTNSSPNSEQKEPTRKHSTKKPMNSDHRPKSSVALASAQRASSAIVPPQGKKVTFD